MKIIDRKPIPPSNYKVGRNSIKIGTVVMHWIVGNLASADGAFHNPSRIASAHYGIEGNTIFQWVGEDLTAYHAGNFATNLKSIGIEHSGGELLADNTRRKPSQQTHETSAQLVADIAKRYRIPLDRNHVKKHNEVSDSPTQCCGSLDIDWIVARAKEINTPQGGDNDMTDDQRKALDSLQLAKTEFSLGNLEGTANAGAGALRDVKRLENDKVQLETTISKNEAKISALEQEVNKVALGLDKCQSDLKDAQANPNNMELGELIRLVVTKIFGKT